MPASAAPQSPQEAQRASGKTLRAATGSAPIPFWWPQPEENAPDVAGGGAARPSTAASSHHEAFAAAEAGLGASMRQRPEYIHWLYAQAQGYQGFVVPHSGVGSVALTTPHPVKDTHAKQIVAQSLESMEDGLFAALLTRLQFRKLRAPTPVVEEPVPETAQERLARRKAQALEASNGPKPDEKTKKEKDGKKGVSWKVGPVSAPPARTPTPGPNETFSEWRELNTLQELLDEGQLTVKEHKEREKKIRKKHADHKAYVEKPSSPKKGETPPPTVDESLEAVPEVAPGGDAAAEADAAAEPEPEEEPKPEPEEDPEPTMEELEALAAAEIKADAEVAKAMKAAAEEKAKNGEEEEEEEVAAEVIEYVPEYDFEPADADGVGHGPALDLLPYECAFKDSEFAEYSFDLRAMLNGYQGTALFCVLRQVTLSTDPDAEESTAWAPLESGEGISLSEGGVVTVEIQSFGRIMVVWLRGLEQTQSLVDFLAAGLLAGLESSGKEADAEFRASFGLRCVAAVDIERAWNGQLSVTQLDELNNQIETDVSSGVFASAEKKEREIAEAAEALRLEQEAVLAAEARIASLPLMLHAACKKGDKGWMDDKDANPEGISIAGIMAEGTDLHLWTDGTGYTALYLSVMYEQEPLVDMLIAAGADVPPPDYVDKENNNGVTALMAAARDGFTSIVLKLLAAGADYAQVDEFGRTADSVVSPRRSLPTTARSALFVGPEMRFPTETDYERELASESAPKRDCLWLQADEKGFPETCGE